MKKKPYHWLQGASVQTLIADLAAAGPNARLEVHPAAGKKITLLVVPEIAVANHTFDHINDSHPCPPDC